MPATVSVPLPAGSVITATIGKLYGSAYASLFIETPEGVRECPVMIGAVVTTPDYRSYWNHVVNRRIVSGDLVEVLVTGAHWQAAEGRLPVVEIMTPGGKSLSALALEQGWVVPNEALLPDLSNRQEYLTAVRAARGRGVGLWRDQAHQSDLREMLSTTFLESTAGGRVAFWTAFKVPVFLLVALCIAYLVWTGLEQRRQGTALGKAPEAGPRRGVARRVGGAILTFLVINPIRCSPFVRRAATPPPPQPAGDQTKEAPHAPA